MALETGSRLGPYEVVGLLGSGGMGEVYRARDPRLERDVAIKVLPEEVADRKQLRRFEQEARAAGALNHPNVLAVYDVGTQDGAPYVVSELLEGQTLRVRLEGGALPVRKALDHALQIAHGLAAAHDKGIVHRDLKPDNVFITERRPGQDPRLRPRQADAPGAARPRRRPGHRPQGHGIGRGAGDGGLHVARAGPGRGGGPPLGHLLLRGGALRDALRRASVPARQRGRDDERDPEGGPARAVRDGPGDLARARAASCAVVWRSAPGTASTRPTISRSRSRRSRPGSRDRRTRKVVARASLARSV